MFPISAKCVPVLCNETNMNVKHLVNGGRGGSSKSCFDIVPQLVQLACGGPYIDDGLITVYDCIDLAILIISH